MKKYILDLELRRVTEPRPGYVVLQLTDPHKPLPAMLPGQFVEVRVDGSPSTFLRRPISINFVDRAANELWLLVHAVGDGTRALAQLAAGDVLNVVLPLGNGFTMPDSTGVNPVAQPKEGSVAQAKEGSVAQAEEGSVAQAEKGSVAQTEKGSVAQTEEGSVAQTEGSCRAEERYLLVGGGVGTAPLLYLGHELKERGFRPTFLLGARSAGDLLQLEHFRSLGDVCLTTEDGSVGERGFVTQHSLWAEADFTRICTCGPKPMMVAVARKARELGIPCEASLENLMACGLGACLCCVEDTVDGHVCVCTEGPVFNTEKLKW